MSGGDGDTPEEAFGGVFSELAGIEGIGFGIGCRLTRRL